jgi:hypothetical protein
MREPANTYIDLEMEVQSKNPSSGDSTTLTLLGNESVPL